MTNDSIGSRRIAIVHEWFSEIAGSERVVEQMCAVFPQADLFAVYANPEVVADTAFLRNRRLTTSFIQRLPFARTRFRAYLSLMPLAVEQLDLSGYDIVISSSHAVAKGVLTGPDQLHISYVHSPIRYAWDLQHQYLETSGLKHGWKSMLARWTLHRMRLWDYRTAAGVDCFVANSGFIARRIKKVYRRDADVIHPPVDVNRFEFANDKGAYYLTASRLVPYKRVDLVVQAFISMPQRRLIVIGSGPELPKLQRLAAGHSHIEIRGHQQFEALREAMQGAAAFVFAAEEDFGIAPVEAQACGTPVIAYGKGGSLETVSDAPGARTGLFFWEQTAASLVAAVETFERTRADFLPQACRTHAEKFSTEAFRQRLADYVVQRWSEFQTADGRRVAPMATEV